MQANPRSISDLFNSQIRYVVPMFQRQYVWQRDPQWQTLWEDIAEKAELQREGKPSTAHYLGALILEGVRPSSPREVKRFLVIDGQQRITTLQILICAIRDVARARDWASIDRQLTRYVENADQDVMERPEEERFKLWPTTLNRAAFCSIVTAGSRGAVEAAHPIIRRPRRKVAEPRERLVEAYLYFASTVEEWLKGYAEAAQESAAFALLQALNNDFAVVEISLSEGDDSQEIFYSLNSQGRPLSQSDLLRSLVFMRAEKQKVDRDRLFDTYWSTFETLFWSAEIKRAGRAYTRLDLALRFFLTAKTGALVDARRVSEEYRRWIAVNPEQYGSVEAELADLARYADVFKHYEDQNAGLLPADDRRRVFAALDLGSVVPLLMYIELDSGLDRVAISRCFGALESFFVRRAFVGFESEGLNRVVPEIISRLRRSDDREDALIGWLTSGSGSTRSWPSDDEVVEAALTREIGTALRLSTRRLLLERLELSLRGAKSEDPHPPASLQIEHVMPQSWAAHWPLDGELIDSNFVQNPHQAPPEVASRIRRRSNLVQTLGNLTLVNQFLNPAASNRPFLEKKTEYEHSVLRLNRHFERMDDWDEQRIEERGRLLAAALCRLYPRPDPGRSA